MATCSVKPSDLTGRVLVPPSKSMGHRALFCAALACGESHIDNFVMSRDMQATLAALRALGVNTEVAPSSRFSGRLCVHVFGTGTLTPTGEVVDCHESGSTARFVIPFSRLVGDPVTVTGQNGLLERPFGLFRDLFQGKGVNIRSAEGWNGCLPLTLSGALQSGVFRLKGNVSSQFITGMLFVLPLLSGDSEILVEGPLESAPYVEMTLEMLGNFGVRATLTLNPEHDGIGARLQIPGGQHYRPAMLDVEGDWSQAAFWLLAGALGHRMELEGLRADSLQGDRAILPLLRRMGAPIRQEGQMLCFGDEAKPLCIGEEEKPVCMSEEEKTLCLGEVAPTMRHGANTTLQAIDMDVSQCPDLVPALAIAAAHANGTSRIGNAARLRFKESDRISTVREMLEAFGVSVTEEPDGLVITGRPSGFTGGFVDGHNDHRIVMAAAIAGTRAATGTISGGKTAVVDISYMEAVQKSYPDFWADYQAAGGILFSDTATQTHHNAFVAESEEKR